MKHISKLSFLFVLLSGGLFVNAQNKYTFDLDLNKVSNDKLTVSMLTPAVTEDSTVFHLPKMVPGTYAIHNYGSYASDVKAFDKAGKPLSVEQRDKNSWVIRNAKQLARIEYSVDDTWDSPSIKEDIFEPAGTNIERDTLFMLNTFGVFGYLKGKENVPVELRIRKPQGFYGSTSMELDKRRKDQSIDVYNTPNYHELADAPIMYNRPDTAWLQVGNARVLVSVYSPGKKASAATLAKDIQPVLEAQRKYLGGTLPVSKYAFIIYLSNRKDLTRYGALEHSQSSVYYLPEFMSPEELSKTMKDVAAHEFFHIVTPLNIHSEEIGNFDYINPKMSRHLWLYEGLTEYAAHHAQLAGGIIDLDTYLDRQVEKIVVSRKSFNDTLSFTQMSLGALDRYKNQYQNVYNKGALIGLALDVKLRELSGGKYSTRALMKDLAKKYGKDRSFKDEELFSQITALTYPAVGSFFADHVEGKKPLPLEETFRSIGVIFNPKDTVEELEIQFGARFGLTQDTKQLFVGDISRATSLGKRLGLMTGDVLEQFNGSRIGLDNYAEVLGGYENNSKVGDTLNMVVKRKKSDGATEEKTLTAVLQKEPVVKPSLKADPAATPAQLELRKAWMSL